MATFWQARHIVNRNGMIEMEVHASRAAKQIGSTAIGVLREGNKKEPRHLDGGEALFVWGSRGTLEDADYGSGLTTIGEIEGLTGLGFR